MCNNNTGHLSLRQKNIHQKNVLFAEAWDASEIQAVNKTQVLQLCLHDTTVEDGRERTVKSRDVDPDPHIECRIRIRILNAPGGKFFQIKTETRPGNC